MRFDQQIAEIVADRESGSSQLLARIQQAFHSIEARAPDPGQLRWAFEQLRGIDPSMAVVHHMLESLEPELGPAFFECLRHYEQHWAALSQRVTTELVQLRDWRNSNILVHSRSGVLLEAVRKVSEHYDGLSVWQTRSEPGGEGVIQFRDLQKLGVAVQLIEDDQVPGLAATLDAAWLGVDQYSEKAFVNKIGSKRITDTMSRLGKTTFILGDPRKRVDTLNFSTTLFEAVLFSRHTRLLTGGG